MTTADLERVYEAQWELRQARKRMAAERNRRLTLIYGWASIAMLFLSAAALWLVETNR